MSNLNINNKQPSLLASNGSFRPTTPSNPIAPPPLPKQLPYGTPSLSATPVTPINPTVNSSLSFNQSSANSSLTSSSSSASNNKYNHIAHYQQQQNLLNKPSIYQQQQQLLQITPNYVVGTPQQQFYAANPYTASTGSQSLVSSLNPMIQPNSIMLKPPSSLSLSLANSTIPNTPSYSGQVWVRNN